jgi:hypothetical protein
VAERQVYLMNGFMAFGFCIQPAAILCVIYSFQKTSQHTCEKTRKKKANDGIEGH